jgi:hypothetical protein
VTKISDVIVPQVFDPYITVRTMALFALYQAGIVANDAHFDMLASQAAKTVNMPYWTDLTGSSQVLADTGTLAVNGIATAQDVAVINRRGQAWGANDLAANLAGADPMKAIGDLVGGYWAREMQAILLKILQGVFTAASMAANKLDISGNAGALAVFSGTTFLDACQVLGDAKDAVTGIAMHSATATKLAKDNLIATLQPTDGQATVLTYMGKRVIIDDGMPSAGNIYTSYIFGPGAIAFGNGSPVGFVPSETQRVALDSNDYLVNRKTFVLHPRGVKFVGTLAGAAPTDAELSTGTNWVKAYDQKAIRIVQFVHKIA